MSKLNLRVKHCYHLTYLIDSEGYLSGIVILNAILYLKIKAYSNSIQVYNVYILLNMNKIIYLIKC